MDAYDATQPLPDSDLVLPDMTTEETDASDNQPLAEDQPASLHVEKKSRRRFGFGADYMSVTVREPSPDGLSFSLSTFELTEVPSGNAFNHLAAFGASVLLGRSDDMAAEFARIVSGKAAERKVSVAKPKVPNFWRQAIALAYVDATKKAPNGPMTLEAATEKANGLERSVMMRLKGDPAVIKHHNKLTGATQGYSVKALLEAEEVAAA